jgi:hypothetical protein
MTTVPLVHAPWLNNSASSVKRITKLKLRDRRTLPASLISYAGTVLPLLWPNNCALVFAVFGESKPSLCQYKTMGKRSVGLTSSRERATATKGLQGQSHCIAHWDKHFLRDALASVSKQAVKRAKNRQFLLLRFCRPVALSREASEIQLCQPCLE